MDWWTVHIRDTVTALHAKISSWFFHFWTFSHSVFQYLRSQNEFLVVVLVSWSQRRNGRMEEEWQEREMRAMTDVENITPDSWEETVAPKLTLFNFDLIKVFLLSLGWRSLYHLSFRLSLLLLFFKFSSPSHFHLSLPTLCPWRAHCMIRNMLIIAKWAIVAKDVCHNKHLTADVGTDTLILRLSQQRYSAVSFERGDNGS